MGKGSHTVSEELRRSMIATKSAVLATDCYPELADHLFRTRGVRVQKSAMQAFCHKHGIRPYRPTYRFLRGDPIKQAVAREELAVLKRGPSAARWSC
jgi:hypothetical protein